MPNAYVGRQPPRKPVKVLVFLSCQVEGHFASGRVVVAATSIFQRCNVSASALTDYSGRLKIELLRR
jgi:hypothetical protein